MYTQHTHTNAHAHTHRWCDRAKPKEHPLYDPRGGDAYWRIECLLLHFNAAQWIARSAEEPWRQQSVRPMDPDGTIQKEAFFEPLTDEEKFSLEPEHFRPEHIIMRRMMREGIMPDDRNLLHIAKNYGYIPTKEDKLAAQERRKNGKAKPKGKPKAKKAHISSLAAAALRQHFKSAGFKGAGERAGERASKAKELQLENEGFSASAGK